MVVNTVYDAILNNVTKYYEQSPENFKILSDIIEKRSSVSITLVEYFTLIYAKNHSTMYIKNNNDFFIVYIKYKNFLKGYGKKYTDLFRRKRNKEEDDFFFTLHDITVKTRLAQLHFFKWAFENEMIAFITDNIEDIEKDMIQHKKNKKKSKNSNIIPTCVNHIIQT